ncbi:hypothetical protein AGOR_G00102200 [Albula goreensis]|uniref:Saposin B-type domain-containing protein n=1 Tax=Albula goreensis TaxID=1534307 RepID=A0A8T3DFF7_9TELE|nr:hypothetical protein AGOR_G00102200 [Albula goreensis]
MLLFVVIGYGLVCLASGKHPPDFDPGEDFSLEFSAAYEADGPDLPDPDEDVPLDFSALLDPEILTELETEFQLHPGTLNGTQEIPGVCWVCRKVVSWVLKRLHRNTRNEISKVLHRTCRRIRISRSLCRYVVNGYFNRLASLILRKHSARWVCRGLRLCWWPQTEEPFPEKRAAPQVPFLTARNRLLMSHRPQ